MTTILEQDPTSHLVQLTLRAKGDDISHEARVAATEILIDTVACAIGASKTVPGRVILRFSQALHAGPGVAEVLDGDPAHRLDPTQAAFVNGHLANLLDADETLLNRSHFAAAVVPAAIAVAQAQGSSGAELIEAVAVGYEVAARVGMGMDHFVQDGDGNVRHVLAGNSTAAFGAAAAAGRLLGLDETAMGHAFGIVSKSAPVHFTWGNEGAFSGYFDSTTVPGLHKYGMYGVLARTGVEATYLARAGYTAAPKPFGAGAEFWKSFGADGFDYDLIFKAPALGWWVQHAALKPWPTCRFGHVALSLFDEVLKESDFGIDEITGLEVTIPSFPFLQLMGDTKAPDIPEKLVFSFPMALAALASGAAPGPRWWSPEVFDDVTVRRIADVTVVRSDSELAELMRAELREHKGYYSIPTRLTVTARGSQFTSSGARAKGDPALNEADGDMSLDLAEKFATFTSGALGVEGAASLYRSLHSINESDNVRSLFAAVADAPTKGFETTGKAEA